MTTFREKKIIYIAYCLSKAQKLRKLKIYPFFIFSNNNNNKKNENKSLISLGFIVIFYMKFCFSIEMHWPNLKYIKSYMQ